jgi:tetrahydrodipicolinate N-succinyltransferase
VEKKARIGACSLITASPGETIIIGEGAMVAAGSVVTKSVEPYTLVAGVPAKPIAKLLHAPTQGTPYAVFKAGIQPLPKQAPPQSPSPNQDSNPLTMDGLPPL